MSQSENLTWETVSNYEVRGYERGEMENEKSEEEYRNLFEYAPEGIITLDMKGVVTSCNHALTRLVGYSKDELVGKPFAKMGFLRAKDTPKHVKKFHSIAKGKAPEPFEATGHRKDGTPLWAEIHPSLLKKNGKTTALQVIVRDIIERKKAEEALAHERDLLHALMDNIPDTIYFKDTESRFTRINKAQARVLGIKDPKEALGKTDFDFFIEEHAKDAYADEQKIIETKQPLVGKIEKTERPDGYYFWTSTTKVPITNDAGEVIGLVGISRDITERKKAEEDLRSSEEKYRSIVELAPDGILTIDLKGKITSCNTAILRQSGYSKDEIVGKHFTKLPTTHVKDIPKYLKVFKDIIRGVQPKPFEFKWIHKDGTIRLGEIHISLMKGTNRIVGFQAVIRDITESKKAEKEIRELAYKLNGIAPGRCYLSKSHERCVKTFVNLAMHDVKGLCIVREDPNKLVNEYSVDSNVIMVLCSRPLKGFSSLTDIQEVSLAIPEFLKSGGDVVLLDGLEYLISRFGFNPVYKMLQEKRFDFFEAKAVLLAPVDLETLDTREKALLQSELEVLK